jgi:hypothetical protein
VADDSTEVVGCADVVEEVVDATYVVDADAVGTVSVTPAADGVYVIVDVFCGECVFDTDVNVCAKDVPDVVGRVSVTVAIGET